MDIERLRIEHYRSIRNLALEPGRTCVVLGANGSGKSNLYRSLRLLHAAAGGRLAEAFAAEGGMPSALYAGPKLRHELHEVRLAVEVQFDRFAYRLACGLPTPRQTMFRLDPEVKEEDLGAIVPGRKRPVPLCERRNAVVTLRDEGGGRDTLTDPLDLAESVLSQLADPRRWPELALVRQILLGWRFYHQFRCDPDAPLRQPRLGVRSPVLADDGANLAAVLQPIRELEHDRAALDPAISAAFPGCALELSCDDRGLMSVGWRQAGIHRRLDARELSDGTLRFLCLAAALLTPRPPPLMVLNEPESSLHPGLLPALAGLVATASERCQVLLTTHAGELAERIAALTGRPPVRLAWNEGQTRLADRDGLM